MVGKSGPLPLYKAALAATYSTSSRALFSRQFMVLYIVSSECTSSPLYQAALAATYSTSSRVSISRQFMVLYIVSSEYTRYFILSAVSVQAHLFTRQHWQQLIAPLVKPPLADSESSYLVTWLSFRTKRGSYYRSCSVV